MDNILTLNTKFTFSCHQGIECYKQCCRDINIFLTPYDVLRMKNRLALSSEDFLNTYTELLISKNTGLPVVVLKMNEDDDKTCPFITSYGCKIYEDRPWACRMAPLDIKGEGKYGFLFDRSRCLGRNEDKEWTVREWLKDQGLDVYNEMEELFNEVVSQINLPEDGKVPPQVIRMFYLVCYNLDKFKEFVFNSSFFDIFDVSEEEIEAIKKDDISLMKFGFKLLKFGIADKNALKIKEEVLRERKKRE